MKRSPLRPMSRRRRRENGERRKLLVAHFAEGAPCEARLPGCMRIASDGHEVLTRARRGSITDPANIVLICRSCHHTVTRHSGWSDRHGWTVPSWDPDLEAAWRLRAFFRCDTSCEIDHRVA